MNPLHLKFNPNSGEFIPDQEISQRIQRLAQQVVGAVGAVIDIHQDAYRYDEHFVFRLSVMGLAGKSCVALSSTPETLEIEDFNLLVVDSVDAMTLMEELRTQLRIQSLPLLAAGMGAGGGLAQTGSARALALSDVIRWHNAQITHYTNERARMAKWSQENDGDSPGAFYEECAIRIADHQHFIARIAEMSC